MNTINTFTVRGLINAGEGIKISYANASVHTTIGDNLQIASKNVIYDYLEELNDYSILVKLTDAEMIKYQYEPQLLAYDLYNYTDMYFIILALNNITSVKDFNMRTVRLIHPKDIDIVGRIIHAEEDYILKASK